MVIYFINNCMPPSIYIQTRLIIPFNQMTTLLMPLALPLPFHRYVNVINNLLLRYKEQKNINVPA